MKNKILTIYPHLLIEEYTCDLYLADYTEQTKPLPIKRGVEVHTTLPTDIDTFKFNNPNLIETGIVIFDNQSFVDGNGITQTQCECVSFPNIQAINTSWILFAELKYCLASNQPKNLLKAKKQLFATMGYFKSNAIIGVDQLCYLIASLPQQNNTPFESFIMSQSELTRLRIQDKVIFRGVNALTIIDGSNIRL